MNLAEIGPLFDPMKSWNAALDAMCSQEDANALSAIWRPLCADACAKMQAWTKDDIEDFRSALKNERRGKFAGEEAAERFGDVIMPTVMFMVSMTAQQFNVPWGLAYMRLREVGRIVERNGIAEWVKEPA